MIRLRPFALALFALLTGCAHAQSETLVLDDLELEGNDTFSDADIVEKLALVATPDWPWADPELLDRGTLAGDRRRLLRFYRANGFYEARVSSKVIKDGDEADVLFVVREGAPTLVADVQLVGIEALPAEVRAALATGSLPVVVGERISEAAHDETIDRLARRLREEGYADARVEGTVQVDVGARRAFAAYALLPGPRVKFGRVLVSGAVKIPRPRVIGKVRELVAEGTRYDERLLGEVQKSLFEMGVFSTVRVSRGPTDGKKGTVPIIVSLREAPFQTVRAGVGVGVDRDRQEGRVTAEWTHRNFQGGLRKLAFENRYGYAFLPSVVGVASGVEEAKSGVVGTSALEFTQPELLWKVDLNLRLEYERGLEPAYDFDAVKSRVGFPIHLTRALTFTPGYNLELYDVRGDAQGSGRAELSAECNSRRGKASDASELCVLSYLSQRLVLDLRDDPIKTRKGYWASLELQQGSSVFGSKFDYDRLVLEQRAYFPLPRGIVLALRLEGGVLFPEPGQISPIMVRFFSGGGTALRSYGTNRLAPQTLRSPDCLVFARPKAGEAPGAWKDRAAVPCVEYFNREKALTTSLSPSVTVPIGGDALLEGVAELRVPIWGELGLVFFGDAGNVARRWNEKEAGTESYVLLAPNLALGTGLRYHTLFGPVRLDFAWRLFNERPTALAAVYDADTGAETLRLTEREVAEDRWGFHFAIGEAF